LFRNRNQETESRVVLYCSVAREIINHYQKKERVMLTGAPGALVKHKKKEFITIKENFVDLFID